MKSGILALHVPLSNDVILMQPEGSLMDAVHFSVSPLCPAAGSVGMPVLLAAFFVQSLAPSGLPDTPEWLDAGAQPLCAIRKCTLSLFEKDHNTYLHSLRVSALCLRLSRFIPMEDGQRALLYVSAFFHDIGKIKMDSCLLTDCGDLSQEQHIQIRRHASAGWEILHDIPGMDEVALAVRHHHERIDGTGYPDAISGNRIPLASRIIAVADSYDAMRSRKYSIHKEKRDIMNEIRRSAGSQLDAEIAMEFIGDIQF